jgi:asparagine synthase (glutamine-hydrolysing)
MAPHVTLRFVSGWVAVFTADGAPVDPGLLRTLIDVPPFGVGAQVWSDHAIGMAAAPAPALLVQDDIAVLFDGRLDDRAALQLLLDVSVDAEGIADVELVVRAYRKWGAACAQHLLGDFAFCIWDRAHRSLVGARDRFGVAPFYFAQCGGMLIVSNVLRSVGRHPLISDRLDDCSVGDLLLFGLAMDPQRTMFADVSRLPPAHSLVCSASGVCRTDRYWELQTGQTTRRRADREMVEEFAAALRLAVSDRVRGGPIGVLMSGGLDSSSVAAMAADVLGTSAPTALRAVTGVYETVAEDEERYYSSLVAGTLNVPIDHLPLDGYALFDRWDSGGLPPEPTTETMTASTADMLARAAPHADAVLTGDGGDPLMLPTTFLGQIGRVPFPRVLAGAWASMRTHGRPPLGIRSAMRRLLQPAAIEPPAWLGTPLLKSFDPRARRHQIEAQRAIDRGPRSAALNAIVDPWWPSTFETYAPGATGQPVAIRYPFFDVRVVDVALRLPSFPFCVNKHVLREAMRGRLMDVVRLRPKTPLAVVPETFHGQWGVGAAVGALESVPGIEQYVDVRTFESSVRPDAVFTDRAALAAVSLAMWLRYSPSVAAPRMVV